MYKALQQSMIQCDIWRAWTLWRTQTTVHLHTFQTLWTREDKSRRCIIAQNSVTLFKGPKPQFKQQHPTEQSSGTTITSSNTEHDSVQLMPKLENIIFLQVLKSLARLGTLY
ncbi:hypothetical protein AMECASPLE_005789 [Ameca splendens]|uniref:Uncharacterized protein n=1 Tax=Ameca splendens TaxID=208324 RepID=A0ABV0YX66_9TELE